MIPQTIDDETDFCQLATSWGISLQLACGLLKMASDLPFGISIISGYRSCQEQDALDSLPCCETGARPCSTHTTSPATGADLWPSVAVVQSVKAHMLRAASLAGLRLGGGSPLDENGYPVDWNHVDLGPVT